MLRALSSIIFPDVVLPVAETTAGQGVLILKEDDDASKIKKLKIMDVGVNSFAFTLDHKVNKTDKKVPCFKQLSSYFHPENDVGINKGCDLVLFTQFRGIWYALMLDMKSKRPDRVATERQLQNSELFVKYVCSLANAYYPDAESLVFHYMKAYITTNMHRNGVYKARKQPSSEYLSVSVEVNDHQEASVHLGKLLGQ